MYIAADDRYESMRYRRSGRSGLDLPVISLGLWQNFGHPNPVETQRDIITTAFDRGITHFDLANNYGPPPGSAEESFGRILSTDLAGHRDELIISTKAGYEMWPGPYGEWGSRKYLLASLDQSLARLDLDYVDIFYSHRPDPSTPLEETIGALHTAVVSGRALYVGISSYSAAQTERAAAIADRLGTPLLIHQPSYSMLNRWIERPDPEHPAQASLQQTLTDHGIGTIAFSPLAQGLLTPKYLTGIPATSRAARDGSLSQSMLTEETLTKVRGLQRIAEGRGQSLPQLAIAWALRDPSMTSVVVGASSAGQLLDNLGALDNLEFTAEELKAIDEFAVDADINIWARRAR